MTNTDAEVGGKSLLAALPHLAKMGVTEDTKCQVYREFLPRDDAIEYTIYFRVPGQAKWRIDGRINSEVLTGLEIPDKQPESVVTQNWTVTYMGPAITAHFSAEDETALQAVRDKRLEELLNV